MVEATVRHADPFGYDMVTGSPIRFRVVSWHMGEFPRLYLPGETYTWELFVESVGPIILSNFIDGK